MTRIREQLRWINNPESSLGRIFEYSTQSLIALSLVVFSIETIPNLPETTYSILSIVEIIIVGLFTIEYLLRFLAAKKGLDYALSFYGIIDFLAIAPFYIFSGLNLQAVRILRFLRLLRILKLTRYNKSINRFVTALREVKEDLALFSIITTMLLFLAAVGIYYFEHSAQPDKFQSIFDSLWWAIATLTTVGYGDIYPITAGGKIFTFIILILGLGIVAVPTGIIASALTAIRKKDSSES